jgi:hypothetical protein
MMSMERRWWITAPLVWASIVAIVALVAWRVIDNAGESVLARPAGEAVTPIPSTSDPTPDPSDAPSVPSDAPSVPSDAPSPTTPGSTTRSPDEPAAARRTSTWQGEEGLLRVSCTGADLQLDGATPQDGYEIDKNERRSGSELEVRFRSIDGDRRVEIEAACVAGVPAFAVERD